MAPYSPSAFALHPTLGRRPWLLCIPSCLAWGQHHAVPQHEAARGPCCSDLTFANALADILALTIFAENPVHNAMKRAERAEGPLDSFLMADSPWYTTERMFHGLIDPVCVLGSPSIAVDTDYRNHLLLIATVFIGSPMPLATKVVADTGSVELWVNPYCQNAAQPRRCQYSGQYLPPNSASAEPQHEARAIAYNGPTALLEYWRDVVSIAG